MFKNAGSAEVVAVLRCEALGAAMAVPSFRKVAEFVGASVLVQTRPLGHP